MSGPRSAVKTRPREVTFSRRPLSFGSMPSPSDADRAKITRSIQERIGYGQIALKYLAAAARLQTILLQAGRATRPIADLSTATIATGM